MNHDNTHFRLSRRGSLIIESVVALTLLATALVALGKLAATSTAIGKQGDQRLAATLAAENLLERLDAIPFEEVAAEARRIADVIEESCGYDIAATTEEFRAGDTDSIHVSVTVRASSLVAVTLHDWKTSVPKSSESGDGDE